MEKYLINPNQKISRINKDIYGHFSEHVGRCVYDGLFVGEDSPIPNVKGMRTDVVEALKEIKVPVLRWPGGCFADEYHWKDGIGKKENRKKSINTNWGNVVEDNSFGTHEFFELCRQLGCDAYVNGNLGSGTVQEMSEWVEYMTSNTMSPMSDWRKENGQDAPWDLKYFAIGNENWGCGGLFEPDYYANNFRRCNQFIHDPSPRKHIYRVACGPNDSDYNWTEQVMKHNHRRTIDGLALHYYVNMHHFPTKFSHSATEFGEKDYYYAIALAYRMEELIVRHLEIMNRYDPAHKVDLIVDEWGTWFDAEPGTNPKFLLQQNTMRDAVVAALTLNIFNKHSDRIKMANIAQIANVLQALVLTDGEEMVLTPTYYVFKMFREHQNNTLLGSFLTTETTDIDFTKYEPNMKGLKFPQLIESASVAPDGTIYATVVNTSARKSIKVKCQVADTKVGEIKAEVLTGKINEYNAFGKEPTVGIEEFTDFRKLSDGFYATLPPCSIVKFIIK